MIENVQKEWEKVFDGTQLKENDKISLISLKSDNEFTTCANFEVYLKMKRLRKVGYKIKQLTVHLNISF